MKSTDVVAPSSTHTVSSDVSGLDENRTLETAQIRVTRAEQVKELAEQRADEEVFLNSNCQPVDLLKVIDLPDTYFEGTPDVTPDEQASTLPEVIEIELTLPKIDTAVTDKEVLIANQKSCEMLVHMQGLARKREKWYCFINYVLVHCSEDSLGGVCQRLVVPKTYQEDLC